MVSLSRIEQASRSALRDNWSCEIPSDAEGNGMQLKTLLNRVQKHSSFVYETVRLVEHPRLAIEVEVRPRANACVFRSKVISDSGAK